MSVSGPDDDPLASEGLKMDYITVYRMTDEFETTTYRRTADQSPAILDTPYP
jgi:hypothetical protein